MHTDDLTTYILLFEADEWTVSDIHSQKKGIINCTLEWYVYAQEQATFHIIKKCHSSAILSPFSKCIVL